MAMRSIRASTAVAAGDEPVRRALAACRQYLVIAATFSALVNILYIAPSIYMIQVYDRVVPTRGFLTLLMLTLIYLLAVGTIAALDIIRGRILIRASARMDRLLSAEILSAQIRTAAGTAPSSSVIREFDQFRQTVSGVGALAIFDAPWMPIYVLICFMLHWALGLLALVSALLLTTVAWLNERSTSGVIKEAGTASGASYRAIDGSLGAAGLIKALGMRDAMVDRHVAERRHGLGLQIRASFDTGFYHSLSKSLRLVLQSLALGLGALLVIDQQISPGSIFAASLLISRSLAPVEQMLSGWKGLVQARQAYGTIVRLFAERGDIQQRTMLPAPQGALEVDELTVLSPTRATPVLEDISFKLAAGEMLGILGASGAGKSTLVKAIAGAIRPNSGTIRIDGAGLDEWPDDQITSVIGYGPQNASLFRGTIKENIARFERGLVEDRERVDREVVRVAQFVGAHDFILRLPLGYETPLGWDGVGLSAGQAHRIALARALYGGPRVVLLDEPNASLDKDGERQLTQAINQLKASGVTLVIVAHRTSILANADKLLLLDGGRLRLFGSREDIVNRVNIGAGAAIDQGRRAAQAPAQAQAS